MRDGHRYSTRRYVKHIYIMVYFPKCQLLFPDIYIYIYIQARRKRGGGGGLQPPPIICRAGSTSYRKCQFVPFYNNNTKSNYSVFCSRSSKQVEISIVFARKGII